MAKKDTVSIFEGLNDKEVKARIDGLSVDPVNSMQFDIVNVKPEPQGSEKKTYTVNWSLQPREEGHSDGSDLVDDIMRRGLQEMPTAWANPEKKIPELLQGHRRMHALYLISEQYPDAFKALFPEGIPIKVYTSKMVDGDWVSLTDDDGLIIRADHDTDALRQPLTTKLEAIRLVKPFFLKNMNGDKSWTTLRIMMLTWRTVCRIMSKQYDALRARYDAAKSEQEKIDIIFNSQKGSFQFLRRMSEAPDILLEYYAQGQKGEATQLKTQKDYEDLSLAFKKAYEADRKKLEPLGIDAANPGKEFMAEFNKVKKEKLKGAATTKILPLNKAEVDALAGKLTSNICGLLIKALQRNADAESLLIDNYDGITTRMEKAGKKDYGALVWCLGMIEKFGTFTEKEMAAAEKCFKVKKVEVSEHVETAEEISKSVSDEVPTSNTAKKK